jgi:AcrR family transcriptional regulator
MARFVSRGAYFETGLEVLSDLGYGGLKLAEVCIRLGVTTGSFYHYFPNWSAYTDALVRHWMEARTVRMIDRARAELDPRRRIDTLTEEGLALPHGAEAAIRSWSSTNPEVRAIQVEVDRLRFNIVYESAFEILGHPRQAQLFADAAMYLLIGYEQSSLPRDESALAWISEKLINALDAGRFANAPQQ